jgi:diacylglycerol O-acyltransferase/trehalose O-mycolyltransferase
MTDNTDTIVGLARSFGEDPLALWGDPTRQAKIWASHNPYEFASKLRGIPLYSSPGDGNPGPLDPPGTTADGIEQWVYPQNTAFAARAETLPCA